MFSPAAPRAQAEPPAPGQGPEASLQQHLHPRDGLIANGEGVTRAPRRSYNKNCRTGGRRWQGVSGLAFMVGGGGGIDLPGGSWGGVAVVVLAGLFLLYKWLSD